jgi:hypothetical protein
VSSSNVTVASLLGVGGRAGIGMACLGSETSASNGETRLAVAGEGYFSHAVEAPALRATTLATVASLRAGGSSNPNPLVVTSDTFLVGSALVVTPSGDVVLGGAASNVVVSRDVASVGDGQLTVTRSNVYVASVLGVGGRVGIGMACTGSEGAAPSGWFDDDCDDAQQGSDGTRLAVAGDIFATGTVVSLSDARAKRSLRRISGALSRMRRLHGYTFSSAADGAGGRRHTGLLAQEVAEVLPEAVYGVPGMPGVSSDAPRLSSIAYGNLAGLFVEAIKELDRRRPRTRPIVRLSTAKATQNGTH